MNYEEELRILLEKRDKLKEVEYNIEALQNEYRKALEPYLLKQEEAKNELNEIENKTIAIKLKDLLLELSVLSGIPESQINYSFKSEILYPADIRKEALLYFLEDENRVVNPPLSINISGKSKNFNKSNSFNYCITNSLKFDDLRLDKKEISDGLQLESVSDKYNKSNKFVIHIDKDDIIFNIHLIDLINLDDLLKQSIITCAKKNNLDEISSIKKS